MSVETTNLEFFSSKMTTPGPGPGHWELPKIRFAFPSLFLGLVTTTGHRKAGPRVDILRISGDNNPSGPVPLEKSTKIIEICKNILKSRVSRGF